MRCLDRNGTEVSGYENPSGLFRFLYDCAAGRTVLKGIIRPGLSAQAGRFLDSRISCILISPFLRKSGIDMADYETGPFPRFNAFFRRQIVTNARCVDPAPEAVISPCDGKLQAFRIGADSRFMIKGISYTMEQLVRDAALAERFSGGTLLLFRLSVDDYHRYAYPCTGIEGERVHLDGVLHTVDPFAAERRPIYAENVREYSLIETPDCGSVLMMEVGALMVGRIVNSHAVGSVLRGEEKGYFEFGASSILVCYERGRAEIDADVWHNTDAGWETRVRQGERIGRICGSC